MKIAIQILLFILIILTYLMFISEYTEHAVIKLEEQKRRFNVAVSMASCIVLVLFLMLSYTL